MPMVAIMSRVPLATFRSAWGYLHDGSRGWGNPYDADQPRGRGLRPSGALADDPFGVLEGHDALPAVRFRVVALGLLEQPRHPLAVRRRKAPGVLVEADPCRRLARPDGLEIARRLRVLGRGGLNGILLRAGAQQDQHSSGRDENSHFLDLP